MTGCGGAGGAGGSVIINPPPGGISVTLSPQSASVSAGGQIQFSANVSGTSDHRVSWSVAGAGSIDQYGLFTASSQPGSATVYAASMVQPSASASTFVTVTSDTDQWVTWSGNGHRYRAVSVPGGISWTNARQAAANMGGYLASPTSAAENNFIFSLINDPKYWVFDPGRAMGPWIGLYQPLGSPEPDGGWTWVSGEVSNFTAWGPPPNNSVGVENFVHYWGDANGGMAPYWNDYSDDGVFPGAASDRRIIGYVVEIGDVSPPPPDQWTYWPVNGHYYRVVVDHNHITWSQARANALNQGADLVSVSSQSENDFVFSLVTNPLITDQSIWDLQEDTGGTFGPWIGVYQWPGSTEPGGGWTSVTGAPQPFTRWGTAEPNNGGGLVNENAVHFGYPSGPPTPTWNDFPDSNNYPGGQAYVHGYVMEKPVETVPPPLQGQLAFTSSRDGNEEIYSCNLDGSNLVNLSRNGARDVWCNWAPDGNSLLFSSLRTGNFEIFRMNADGSSPTQISHNGGGPGNPDTFNPCWLPDGSKIIFQTGRDWNWEIYQMNPDGSGLENRTKNGNDDVEPSVSSDGNRIAFASTRDGGYQIYVMNRDGSGQTRLTYGGSIDTNPGWSPDGSKLAFMSNRDGDYEIYVMNSDGTNIRQITMNAAWDGEPSWSPDGQHIAFASDRSGVEQIYYADADGSNVIQVPCGAANNGRPVWRPNH